MNSLRHGYTLRSDSAKSKPFLVDGKEMNRLSPQESYGHADDKDEKRFKLTDKKSSVEKNVCNFKLTNKLTYQINPGYRHHK